MKGYLKTSEGIFQLAPKVTTVGRDGCDLVIQSQGVDHQHAVIEYSIEENCFVLQDLNTAQGTYVNDCRVQNATVRLAPGDVIQFGFSSAPYQLEVDNHQAVAYPPVQQRPAWTQPLTVITDPVPPQVVYTQNGLPHLKQVISPASPAWQNSTGVSISAVPKPPPSSMRTRPLSAGSRRTQDLRHQGADNPAMAQRANSGWVAGHGSPAGSIHSVTPPARSIHSVTPPAGTDVNAIQEREQRVLRMNEEIRRLSIFESECSRKEVMIQQLREEIGDLQNKLRHMETSQSTSMLTNDAALTDKLIQLENEVSLKRTEVQSLKDQINQMKSDDQRSSPINRQDLNDRIMEVNSLKTELERTKKDKNITSGLVSQMQRDMSSKDITVARLRGEIENLKKEAQEKEVQVTSLQSKFRRTQETKKSEEEIEAKEKELAQMKLKTKMVDKRMEEQTDVIESLKEELEKIQKKSAEAVDGQKKIQADLDAATAKYQDFERTERSVRVDLEQSSKRIERFRNRVVQVTFSTPGIRAPDKEINDDELMETLKKVVDERTELMRKLQDAKENITVANSTKKDIIDSSKKIKQQLNEAVERLCAGGLSTSNIRKEVDLIQTTSVDDTIVWVRDNMVEMLQTVMSWQQEIDTSLTQAGFNVKISDEAPGVHIAQLFAQATEAKTTSEELRVRLAQAEDRFKNDMDNALESARAEAMTLAVCEKEQIKLESEEKMNRIIEEIRETETQKRENAAEAERAKIEELEVSIVQLKSSILENEEDFNSNKESTREALEAVENYKKIEIELRAEIEKLSSSHQEQNDQMNREIQDKVNASAGEASAFKEQARQHSVTICAMEERLNRVMKKSKDYQTEIATLRSAVSDLKKKLVSRPSPPPKPKVIVQKPAIDIVAMEQTMIALQKEIADYKMKIAEQQDVITGLRRDLTGASARLSDMTGEMSEAQKEAIENSRMTIHKQERELTELRQQMAKLSTIVDRQSEEVRDLKDDTNKKNAALNKYKNVATEHEAKLRDMESHLTVEKEKSQKSLCLVEEEGRITSELSAIGAQCRGDRHEQVIARQREALTELRARIKALEQSKPPLPTSPDQALQQVVLLKKELAELRASQAVSESQSPEMAMIDAHISRTRGIDPQSRAEADVERSAHRETLESLEQSEGTYLTLLRGIASALEMEEIGGLRSMAHIPRDERRRLSQEREAAVELLTSRVKVLQERINRKDDLLAGYERDLAKLRQAEKLAETKHSQVESLATDIRSKTEESQYLRETLHRTKDKLEQEKRLNAAIKHKKTFHLENESVSKGGWPRHQCPPEDLHGQNAKKKKEKNEKIKRKNYEIKTLKSELSYREQDLQTARRKVTTMEATMGMDSGRDPFEPPSVEAI